MRPFANMSRQNWLLLFATAVAATKFLLLYNTMKLTINSHGKFCQFLSPSWLPCLASFCLFTVWREFLLHELLLFIKYRTRRPINSMLSNWFFQVILGNAPAGWEPLILACSKVLCWRHFYSLRKYFLSLTQRTSLVNPKVSILFWGIRIRKNIIHERNVFLGAATAIILLISSLDVIFSAVLCAYNIAQQTPT